MPEEIIPNTSSSNISEQAEYKTLFQEFDVVIPSQSKEDLRQTAEALTLAIELLANEEIYSLQIVPLVRILRNYIDAEPSQTSSSSK